MKKRNIIRLLITTFVLLGLSGCTFPFAKNDKAGEKENIKAGYGEAYIYYHEDMRVKRRNSVYQLRQPDVLTASVEELLGELMKEYEGVFSVYTYMFDENNVRLEVSFTAPAPLSREVYLLSTASICTTLFQLEGISGIRINIFDEDEKVLLSEEYERSSFFFGGYDKAEGLNEIAVKIYMPYNGERGLRAYMLDVNPDYHISAQELIVNYLAKQQCIPPNTSVISVSVTENECVIDLSDDFEQSFQGRTPEEVLYAVVNSLTSLDGIDSVRILIGGESRDTFRGNTDISGPLKFNSDIVIQ